MQRQVIRFLSGIQGDDKVETQLKYWARQLHDLSGRNRLLYYRESKASSGTILDPPIPELFHLLVEKESELRVPLPSPVELARLLQDGPGKSPTEVLDALVPAMEIDSSTLLEKQPDEAGNVPSDAGSGIESPGRQGRPRRQSSVRSNKTSASRVKYQTIATNHSVARLNDVMYNLRYAARTVQEEQGFNILYITFGMLHWREARSPALGLAPLVLVPIRLDRKHPGSPYTIHMAEDDIVVNPALQIKLFKDFGFQLPDVGNDLTKAGLRQFLSETEELIDDLEGWEIEERATIGAFNFLTQLLIKDFENHAPLYVRHPLVRWVSGIDPAQPARADDLPAAEQLDDRVDPTDVHQVLDADSSQQEAIEAAKRGLSFVLQGPPGTGKSQTIANLIAESIMAGKRVLFVSQKMAALEVVQNRLRSRGLAEFCLEVHSHRMDKRKVIRDLMSCLSDSSLRVKNPEHGMRQNDLRQTRDELNTYVRQLHESRLELGLSLYELYGQLAQFLDDPAIDFPLENVETISPDQLSKMRALIREAAGYGELIRGYAESRWKGWKGTEISLVERERTASLLRSTQRAIEALHGGVSALADRYGLTRPASVAEDLQLMQVLTCFTPEVFSSRLRGAVARYRVQALPGGKVFSLQYGEDSRKMEAAYRNRSDTSSREVGDALVVLRKIIARGTVNREGRSEDDASGEDPYPELQELLERVQAGYNEAKGMFSEDDLPIALAQFYDQGPQEASTWFSDQAEHANELADWADFNSMRRLAGESGLGAFIDRALEEGLTPDRWEGAFCQRFYRLCIERVVKDRPILQRFKGTSHSDLVRRFRDLDLASIERSANRIRAELSQRKPQWSWLKAQSAETSVIRREFNKRRALKPLRRLFSEIPNLVQALKPCLMMSPLTVCQLLDPAIYHFDLAVFDEASQIPPEYAISAFLRCSQVVVAGDSQQLPPMNFFQTMEDESLVDEKPEDETEFESILSLCDSRGFPSKMLNWHYRSRDESLIAYSNFHFYDNRLCTFPSAQRDNPSTGLKFVHVPDGAYYGGEGARDNPVEAKRVAQLVFEHLSNAPELSLGIVTFSMPQRRAIEREIDHLRMSHRQSEALFRYDRQEPLFVKNLENVQGDERDVIILSVGYGRDEAGKIALNFGPLNRDGGARRLNVAVTRARRLVYLVASMEPEDIDLGRATSQGARLLRSYLETARDGVAALYPAADDGATGGESAFEGTLYRELAKRGLELARRVGVSQYRVELAIKDPENNERFILGLESDGDMYRSGLTARDRDRLRQQVLEGLGWRLHRVWSRDWIQDREGEIQKVLELMATSREEDVASFNDGGPIPVVRAPARPIEKPSGEAGLPAGAVPFRRQHLARPAETGAREFLTAPLSQIIDQFQTLANDEGPILLASAKMLVARAWEVRKNRTVVDRLESALKKGSEQGAFLLNGNFLWPSGRQVAPLRVHVEGEPVRKINEIAPEEIERAVRECVRASITIGHEDLVREAGRLFGLRHTAANEAPIGRVVERLLHSGVLQESAGKVSAGANF